VLLKGMQSVVGLLRPIAALLPDWLPAENFLSLVVVLIICFAVGSAVRTRAGRAVRERMEMSFFGRLPGYALFRGLSQRLAPPSTAAPAEDRGHSRILGLPRDVSVRLAGAMLPPGTCRAAARYYTVPDRSVALSALKASAATAPPSSSAPT
jgi:ABC-type xylose transport system permease subunit